MRYKRMNLKLFMHILILIYHWEFLRVTYILCTLISHHLGVVLHSSYC